MVTNGPGLFSDIDLLTKDYDCDQKFTSTTNTDTGVALSSTVAKKGGLSSGDVAARYNHKNAVLTMFTVTDIPPSTKTIASFKLPDYKSGRLEVQYRHEHATFTSAVGLNESPAFDFSATIGTPSISFGAEASYMTASGNFAKYDTGVNLTKPDSSASVILVDKGDSLRVSYLHHLNRLNGGAEVGEISRRFSANENTLTVRCSYVVDPHTVVKA